AAVAEYQKNIVLMRGAGNSAHTMAVTLTTTPAAPAIAVTSVVNGASFVCGPVASNTIVTAFGTFPGCVSNAQATVDGTAVEVFHSSATQISLLMPGRVAGETAAPPQNLCGGPAGAPVDVAVVGEGPAAFPGGTKRSRE